MNPSAERVVRFQEPLMLVHRLLEPTAGRAANGEFNQAKCAEIQRVFLLLLLFFCGSTVDVAKDLGSQERILWKVKGLQSRSDSSSDAAHLSLDGGSGDVS